MKTAKTTIISIFALFAAVFFSCETPVALGKRINMDPPSVTITEPGFMDSVGEVLKVLGTAKDKEEVVSITITVEKADSSEDAVPWLLEWYGERGVWQSRTEDTDWVDVEDEDDVLVWNTSGGKGNILWSVTMPMQNATPGEYLISVGAVNNVGKAGAIVQRRVMLDNMPPVVTVITPSLQGFQLKDDWNYDRRNAAHHEFLHNQKIVIQYEIKDDFSVDTLAFQLMDGEGNYYYNEAGVSIPSVGWSGRFEIEHKDILDPITHDPLPLEDGAYEFLQLRTIVSDRAGNLGYQSHGWLAWWPQADRPWMDGAGGKTPAEAALTFPKSFVRGQAYDNESVASVKYTYYTGWQLMSPGVYEEDGDVYMEGELINTPPGGSTPSATFNLNIPSPSVTGQYMIKIEVFDNNGLTNEPVDMRFIDVYDVFTPTITFHSDTTQYKESTLFGDTSGNFHIKGTIEDGRDPWKLDMVWIKPDPDFALTLMQYSSADYTGWNNTPSYSGSISGSSNGQAVYQSTDSDGNKQWSFNVGGGPPSVTPPARPIKNFDQTFSLFGTGNFDLGISNDVPLADQYFVLRLEGAPVGTDTRGKAITEILVLQGDLVAPTVTILQAEHMRGGSTFETYTRADYIAGNSLRGLELDDEIRITGTWDDDSRSKWTTVHMNPTVTWNGIEMAVTITAGGTWEASLALNGTAAGEITKAGGFVEVKMRDMAGNTEIDTLPIRIETDIPGLISINADQPAGAYRTGTLKIYLEFNKPVTLEPNTASPTLTLNNGGTAAYAGTGSAALRHYFDYAIPAASYSTALNVTGINMGGGAWQSGTSTNTAPVNNTMLTTLIGGNLADNKLITIDTARPAIQAITSTTGDPTDVNTYRQGQTVYITAAFDKPIRLTNLGTGQAGTRLTLNAKDGSDNAAIAINPVLSGTSNLRFEYTIGAGYNTPFTGTTNYTAFLDVEELTVRTGARIEDYAMDADDLNAAGNTFDDAAALTAVALSGSRKIVIDNEKPGAPAVSGLPSETTVSTSQKFTISGESYNYPGGGTAAPTLEYSITGTGGPWYPYTGEVTLSAARTYNISAKQTDPAGNESDPSPPETFSITMKPSLITSLGGSSPGTYSSGNVEIHLNLREQVTVTGVTGLTLTLFNTPDAGAANTFTGETATYSGLINDGKTMVFTYRINEGDAPNYSNGDNVDKLDFSTINIPAGMTVTSTVDGNITEDLRKQATGWNTSNGLSSYTDIKIKTGRPSFQSASFDAGGNLVLRFDRVVYKQTQADRNITITQDISSADTRYRAPVIISEADWRAWEGDTTPALSGNYTKGTNGAVQVGGVWTSDTDTKYVLNYDAETADTGAAAIALRAKGAHIRVIPAASGAVSGSGTNTLTVNLSALYAYSLRVKGVRYLVSFPASLVTDELGNFLLAGVTDNPGNPLLWNVGVNEPVVRVNKAAGRYTFNSGPGTATQQRTVAFRVDTQTPQATVGYQLNLNQQAPDTGRFGNNNSPPKINVTMPNSQTWNNGTANSTTVNDTLGDNNNWQNGYLYGIRARAQKTVSGAVRTAEGNEIAARSVIIFRNPTNVGNGTWNSANNNRPNPSLPLRVWIRGGDELEGGNTIVGFPLGWDIWDWANLKAGEISGAQLLTANGGDNGDHYWITWEVNKTAYFKFMIGTVDAQSGTLGPKDWAWAKNRWAFQHQHFPLYPGGSLQFTSTTTTISDATADLEWHTVFDSRP